MDHSVQQVQIFAMFAMDLIGIMPPNDFHTESFISLANLLSKLGFYIDEDTLFLIELQGMKNVWVR
jgi:hypothetical protein